MRYHILVANSHHGELEDQPVKLAYIEQRKIFIEMLKKLTSIDETRFKRMQKRQKDVLLAGVKDYPIPLYWFDETQMKALAGSLSEEDALVIHGEGNPFIIGLNEPSIYDLSPLSFGKMLDAYEFPRELGFNIEFLSCNTGSSWKCINFSQICSLGLSVIYHYPHLHVSGYAAYVVEKDNGKFSASLDIDKDTHKHLHLDLKMAMVVYRNGEEIAPAKKIAKLENNAYDWAKKYIDINEKEIAQIVERKAEQYYLDFIEPRSIAEAREFSDFLVRETHNLEACFEKLFPSIFKEKEEGSDRWLQPLQKTLERMIQSLQASEGYQALIASIVPGPSMVMLGDRNYSLWARRAESSETQKQFDDQFGLTVI